jgi:mono/diheme cytochrome c family protein
MRYLFIAVAAILVGSMFVWDLFGTEQPSTALAAEVDGAKLSYAKDIKPILEDRCFSCHNPNKKKAGIDLQGSFASMLKSVKPGSPEESRLYKSMIGKGAKQMPPKKRISDDEINLVKAWISAGAKNN